MKKDFTISEALSRGWDVMKANIWYFVGVLIVAWLVTGIPRGISQALEDHSPAFSLLFQIIYLVMQTIVSIGIIKIALSFLAEKKPEFAELFRFQPFFWKFLGGSILYGLIVVGGLLLLIVPGIYWAIKFQFFGYCIIDQKLGPVEALKKSSKITENVKWRLLWFGIITMLVSILGVLCFIIGLFAAVPTVLIAYAYVYRKLNDQTEATLVSSESSPATV